MKQIKKIGEWKLIEYIRNLLRRGRFQRRVFIGIGDDAAVLRPYKKLIVFTTDTMVEGVHFDLSYDNFFDVGWRALASNLSDIAAMGGIPICCLVSLAIPGKMKVRDVKELYMGIKGCGEKFGCEIVGGDTVNAKEIVISICVLGEVKKENLSLRSGARVGDRVFVTGELGGAEARRNALKQISKFKFQNLKIKNLIEKHKRPLPKLKEAEIIIKKFKVNSMIDISDGLVSELYHIAEESKVGFRIYEDKIPVESGLKFLTKREALNYALYGGEEYELLFTASRGVVSSRVQISEIGEVVKKEKKITIVNSRGREKILKRGGWEHFKS